METQNVTLAIPKDVLGKAKRVATERRTSLSGLMTEMLKQLVEKDDSYRVACARQIALLEHGLDIGTYGKATWSRAELHER